MAKQISENASKVQVDDSQLHWFWKLTTKWWFFPVFYVVLAFLATIQLLSINGKGTFSQFIDASAHIFFLILVFMPTGLQFYLSKFYYKYYLAYYISPVPSARQMELIMFTFDGFIIISIIMIQYFKLKKNITLKWLIITLIVLLLLAFFGCVADPEGVFKIMTPGGL